MATGCRCAYMRRVVRFVLCGVIGVLLAVGSFSLGQAWERSRLPTWEQIAVAVHDRLDLPEDEKTLAGPIMGCLPEIAALWAMHEPAMRLNVGEWEVAIELGRPSVARREKRAIIVMEVETYIFRFDPDGQPREITRVLARPRSLLSRVRVWLGMPGRSCIGVSY